MAEAEKREAEIQQREVLGFSYIESSYVVYVLNVFVFEAPFTIQFIRISIDRTGELRFVPRFDIPRHSYSCLQLLELANPVPESSLRHHGKLKGSKKTTFETINRPFQDLFGFPKLFI